MSKRKSSRVKKGRKRARLEDGRGVVGDGIVDLENGQMGFQQMREKAKKG